MSYARGPAVLGDAWGDYLAHGYGPPGGSATSPNGDVVVFDADGQVARTIVHSGSGTDGDVDRDPRSATYGWTNLQKAALAAAQGVLVSTDAIRAALKPVAPGEPASIPEELVAANQASLVALASRDPKITAALEQLKTGAFGSDAAARSAESERMDDIFLRRDAEEYTNFMERVSARFPDAQSREAFIADYIARAKRGSEQPGLPLADAVKAGILSAEAARRITSVTPPATTAATEGVYLKDGQYVDAGGSRLSAAMLQQLRIPPVSSSSSSSSSSSNGSNGSNGAAPAIADQTGYVQLADGDEPGIPWGKIGLVALVAAGAALALRKS